MFTTKPTTPTNTTAKSSRKTMQNIIRMFRIAIIRLIRARRFFVLSLLSNSIRVIAIVFSLVAMSKLLNLGKTFLMWIEFCYLLIGLAYWITDAYFDSKDLERRSQRKQNIRDRRKQLNTMQKQINQLTT